MRFWVRFPVHGTKDLPAAHTLYSPLTGREIWQLKMAPDVTDAGVESTVRQSHAGLGRPHVHRGVPQHQSCACAGSETLMT